MIKKLLQSEFLTSIERMTDEERKEYLNRVREWLRTHGTRLLALTDRPMAQAQNVMVLSNRWAKEDCDAVHEGARLLTALMGVTETWLPSVLWSKSGWRVVRKLTDELSAILNSQFIIHNGAGAVVAGRNNPNNQNNRSNLKTQTANPAAKPQGTVAVQAERQAVPSGKPTGANPAHGKANASAGKPQGTVKGAGLPVRPKHIDQYVHLLPQNTQERAAQYGPLMREMDEARENLRLLMTDPKASATMREGWAKKVTKIDATIGAIRRELDAEWERLVESGRVKVDELGMAHVVSPLPTSPKGEEGLSNQNTRNNQKKAGRPPMTEEEKAAKRAEREKKRKQEQVRRAGLIRKWLIDLRNAKTEGQKEKWMQKYKEMVAIGGEKAVTEKVKEAAVFYGVELNS